MKIIKIFCLSLHYNEANSYLFVHGTEIAKFKAKDSEIVVTSLCLRNISKDWTKWICLLFIGDYDAIAFDDI